jgi:hypothetical protein
MTRHPLLAAAVILSAANAAPALAQPVIDEPGAYAFYHPNGDLGLGSSRPADAMAQLRGATMSHPLPVRRPHRVKPY